MILDRPIQPPLAGDTRRPSDDPMAFYEYAGSNVIEANVRKSETGTSI